MDGDTYITSFGSMTLYYFASMDRHDHDDIANEGVQRPLLSSFKSSLAFINRRESRSLAIFGLLMTTNEVSFAIGYIHTHPNGIPLDGWFCIFWLNLSLLYFSSQLRTIPSQMSAFKISSYLSTNILAIGISSITPMMMYLSLDTIKCASNADRTQNIYDQCSRVSTPQLSICIFLLIMLTIKVLIAPLSTTTITTNDLIKLNLSRRFIFHGALFGVSFFLNLYLFAHMEEGKVTDSIGYISGTAIFLPTNPLTLEVIHTIFQRDHRTSLVPPTQRPNFTSFGGISFSPADSLSPQPN